MFSVLTASRFDDNLPTPYLVALQITIEDEEFKQRLIRAARRRNIRLGCDKKTALASAISLDDLAVEIVRDEVRLEGVGYLDEYIEHGYVFGFEEETEAKEFEEKAQKVMVEFLQAKADEHVLLTKDRDGQNHPAGEHPQSPRRLAPVILAILVVILAVAFSQYINSKKHPSDAPSVSRQNIKSSDPGFVEPGDIDVHENMSENLSIEDIEMAEELKTYLFENFGGFGDPSLATSWYGYIDDIKVFVFDDGNEITIYTSIYPDEEGKEFATKYFPPVWGWANMNANPKNIRFVNVLGQNNSLLSGQKNPLY